MDVTSLIKMLVCSQILFLWAHMLGEAAHLVSAHAVESSCVPRSLIWLPAGRVGMCCVSCLLRRLAPTHRGFWRHLRGGEAQMQLCRAVLKRVWRWIMRRHRLNYQPCTVRIRWGRSRQRTGMGCQYQPALSIESSQWTWVCRHCSSTTASLDVPDSIGALGCTEAWPRRCRN